jgi:hypothetical protein
MAIIEEAIKEQPRLTLDEIWERGNRLGLSTPSESVQMIREDRDTATRVAKLRPGDLVQVEVIGDLPTPCAQLPTVGDRLL